MKVPDTIEYFRASQISPCGADLGSEEVLVLELNDNEYSDELMSHPVDGASLTLSPPVYMQLDGTRAQTVRRMRAILAYKGCNLLVLEEGIVVRQNSGIVQNYLGPASSTQTYLNARWGSH